MYIRLENIGKRYHRDWILRGISASFSTGDKIAVLGNNGSGKSTFLRIVAGLLTPSEGNITWETTQNIAVDRIYKEVTWTAPYQSIYEDYSLAEAIAFHAKFKSWAAGLKNEDIPALMGLAPHANKPVRQFSSGMKQRVKLGLAILSNTPVLLLDEPSSHLDAGSVDWFVQLLSAYSNNRIVFIASNQEEREVSQCNRSLEMTQFKNR